MSKIDGRKISHEVREVIQVEATQKWLLAFAFSGAFGLPFLLIHKFPAHMVKVSQLGNTFLLTHGGIASITI
ncbi:hypothetical protein [Sansalvadorimonas verongulae]|uniref:hypothetical protein n=1 Tax=Sansalvadorimonas verongulae TaxID=2172824 RepID=UPI0012BC2000|nr:hypothetical protein [Sansalvadorimonas verongulae]MTI15551.1 hypothetical protein [Sansalvadorimonas verongulae]